ncbi:MAG: hypothetical protein M5U34_46770 [Chloroflexi bacterium]|nr:hypothetical protein [Chloroflexota bacterium]
MNDKELWPPNTITYNVIWFAIGVFSFLFIGAGYYGLSVLTGSKEKLPEAFYYLMMASSFIICIGLIILRTRVVIYFLALMFIGVVLYGTVLGHDLHWSTLGLLGIYIWHMMALLKKGELV